jgi:membrane-associated protein
MIDLLLHFDQLLPQFFADYGTWVYGIAFLIIFCETGLVVAPFLPGDSMLFALGAFAAQGSLNVWWLLAGLFAAALLGDNVNYCIGRNIGAALLKHPRQRLFKPQHYEKAHAFYEKWGGLAIILARFAPIIRTFSPFVAGVARMGYHKFLAFDIVGGAAWVGTFIGLGYAMGNLPWVKGNFEIVAIVIIVVSLTPIAWGIVSAKLRNLRAASAARAE